MKRNYETYEGSNRIRQGAIIYKKRPPLNMYQRRFPKAPPRTPYKLYVPRTPGGQVISEKKYFDTRLSSHAVAITNSSFAGAEADPTLSGINCLFAPTQGNDISNREGRNCYVYSIQVRGVIEVAPQVGQSSVDQSQTCRLILCMDKQTNGSQMNSEDLITSSGGAPGTFQYQNTANFGRFQILKDKIINFAQFNIAANGAGNLYQAGASRYFKMNYTFKTPIRVNFNSTNGGTIADIVDNSFHLLAGRDNADTPVNLDYQVRVSFTG